MLPKVKIIIILFLILSVFGCTPLALDNPVDPGHFSPSGTTLAEKVLSDLDHRLTVLGSERSLATARSLSSTVQTLVSKTSAEIDFRGWKTTEDLTKILPALSHGMVKGLQNANLEGNDLENFAEIVSEVIVDIALSSFYQDYIHYTKKDLAELLGKETARALKHLSSGRRPVVAKARMRSLVTSLNKMGLDLTETRERLEDMIAHAITSLVLDEYDATTIQSLITAMIDGAGTGLKRLTEVNSNLATIKENLLTAVITKTGAGVKTLEIDCAINATQSSGLLSSLKSIFETVSTEMGLSLDENALLTTGYGSPLVPDDIIIPYPENEFLVLKFKTMTRLEKEQFWRGQVGHSGILVGETLYFYNTEGNIIKKEYYYDGTLYDKDENFVYSGTRLITDQWGNNYTYDELGRVARRDFHNGHYEIYEYLPNGKVVRNFFGDGGLRYGSGTYTIKFAPGVPRIGVPTFWYGNHSVQGIGDWTDSDRYDIIGAIVSLGVLGRIEVLEHYWVDDPGWKSPPNAYKEYAEFNDVGKLTRFFWLDEFWNMNTLTYEKLYDPFQRFRKGIGWNYSQNTINFTKTKSYRPNGNTSSVSGNSTDGSFIHEIYCADHIKSKPVREVKRWPDGASMVDEEFLTQYSVDYSILMRHQVIWEYSNSTFKYLQEHLFDSLNHRYLGYDEYFGNHITKLPGEFVNITGFTPGQSQEWVYVNDQPTYLVEWRNNGVEKYPFQYHTYSWTDQHRGIHHANWNLPGKPYDPFSKIPFTFNPNDHSDAITTLVENNGSGSFIAVELKLTGFTAADIRNGKTYQVVGTNIVKENGNYLSYGEISPYVATMTNGELIFNFFVSSGSFSFWVLNSGTTNWWSSSLFNNYSVNVSASANDKITITIDMNAWKVIE